MSSIATSAIPDFISNTGLNPITVEVIGSALFSIVEEMGENLVRSAYSTNIKERRDCSTAMFDAEGNTLCQASHIPGHLGSFIDFVPLVLERNPLKTIKPGDVFIGNDAYEGGVTHLPDIVLCEPVFNQDQLVAWAINTAHHTDFIDRGSAHIFQEGLRIPPIKLYQAGVLQKDIQDLILLNCQVPRERLSDLRAQMAANRLGVTRMQALCEKYGIETVRRAGVELMDYSERRTRAGIAEIPNGTYEFKDIFDTHAYREDMDFSVKITVRGDEMDVEFQSPPQVRAAINVIYSALRATVYHAIKSLVDPTVPPNAGLTRPIHVIAKEGTVLRCSAPAAVYGRTSAMQRVVDMIFGAMAQIVPERVIAAGNGACTSIYFVGVKPDNSPWTYLETIGGGSGARFTKDGLDGVHVHMTNTSNLPVEAAEGEYPLTILRYELVDESGGPGKFRGGMGVRRVYRFEDTCRIGVNSARVRSHPWGLHGGQPGAVAYFSSSAGEVPAGVSAEYRKGDRIEIVTAGAGGSGNPAERSSADVERDLREGRIQRETARRFYPQVQTSTLSHVG
ncbi:hydantoinase B/oxoprolinase family protein [Bradyrhizobium sp. BWA-3-5]|uniref:hydantoinase B/oxoprolinase family protein n=1 Tax=Bradyrhizobium sp. BWA-3-5 TaxID=3080013 RepID=UPI00293F366D|nr:hydantoinase B/oxoprolinase family protein [Bradyrhizobium sp. BWA-3-5]WOH63743.1 hydantoinase B/oxoprolinase family protein [Bradyrhizobium sp. BWA-3-5]